jgi:hypothetical protein
MIDALYADLNHIESLIPLTCLEIGPGSGVLITSLALLLLKHKSRETLNFTFDVN